MEYVIRTGISHGELDKIFRKLESAKQAIYEGYCQLEKLGVSSIGKTEADDQYVKEVYETKSSLRALEMIQSGAWTISSGYRQGDEVTWILLRR